MSRTFQAIVVSMAEYADATIWKMLPDVDAIAARVASIFGSKRLEFERRGEAREVAFALKKEIDSLPERATLLLHWIGHGQPAADQHYLICWDSPEPGKLDAYVALPSGELGRLLAKSSAERIVVILDTCFSGGGTGDLAQRYRASVAAELDRDGWDRVACVIASAHPLDRAVAGRFSVGLADALEHPEKHNRWSSSDEFLDPETLAIAARDLLGKANKPVHPRYSQEGLGSQFLPNPRFRRVSIEMDLETARMLEGVFGEAAHFDLSARGIETLETGHFFSGRTRIILELSNWLASEEQGLTVVTGAPGSGKSALLGRLVTLTVPEFRAMARARGDLVDGDPLPPENGIDVAIHAKGKTVFDCAHACARLVGRDSPIQDQQGIGVMLEAVRSAGKALRNGSKTT